MKLNKKLVNPIGGSVGLIIGLVTSVAIGNVWIGLGIGAVIAVLISPMYEDKARIAKAKNVYWITLAIVIPVFVLGALALTLLAL